MSKNAWCPTPGTPPSASGANVRRKHEPVPRRRPRFTGDGREQPAVVHSLTEIPILLLGRSQSAHERSQHVGVHRQGEPRGCATARNSQDAHGERQRIYFRSTVIPRDPQPKQSPLGADRRNSLRGTRQTSRSPPPVPRTSLLPDGPPSLTSANRIAGHCPDRCGWYQFQFDAHGQRSPIRRPPSNSDRKQVNRAHHFRYRPLDFFVQEMVLIKVLVQAAGQMKSLTQLKPPQGHP